ncbi:hypothetical protein BH23PAT2_BH23PAT2_01410 [soil metagenome]
MQVLFCGGIGEHHDEYRWVDVNTFKPGKLFEGGWKSGLEEYLESIKSISN